MNPGCSGRLIQTTILSVLTVVLVCSCSNARKNKDQTSPLIAEVIGEPSLSDEQIAELKKIADDPNSHLEENLVEDTSTATTPIDPAIAWKKGDFQPRSIQPGDIFFEQSGAILHKAASISDTYSDDEWQSVLASYSGQSHRIVPLTLSQEEIVELTNQTGGNIELPTRSVALDFKTKRTEIKARKLESYFQEVMAGSSQASSSANREVFSECLVDVKSRIARGEEFYVITAVTASDSVRATYPGAPVGKRDAQLILNALLVLYPHLDQLAAEKKEHSIIFSRDPKIYWEYEASPLVLENGKLKIETSESTPLFSQFSFRNQ